MPREGEIVLNYSQNTLTHLLQQRTQQAPDTPLFSFLNKNCECTSTLTFSGLYTKAAQLAQLLHSRGIAKQPVLLCYPDGCEFVVAFFGCILAGAWPVPVPVGRGRHWGALPRIAGACHANAVLTTESRKDLVSKHCEAVSGLMVMCSDSDVDNNSASAENWRCVDAQPDDIAFIQYTSGSTAGPKGVVITHQNVLHNSMAIKRAFQCVRNDIGVSWLPLHHDMGLIGHVIQPLFSGIHNYFLNPADFVCNPLRWLQAISRYGGTISGGPDFAYAHCCAKPRAAGDDLPDLKSWRIAYTGAERVSPSTIRRFSKLFQSANFNSHAFFPCYGLAESTLFVSGQHYVDIPCDNAQEKTEEHRYQSVSLGVPNNDMDVVIVDHESEQPVAEGDIGEIYIRSCSVSPGYYLDAQASSRNFNRTVLDKVGYFRTGDMGRLEKQQLYFSGRRKNCIKRRGLAWYSEDIEAQVERHMASKGVLRCAAINVFSDQCEKLVLLLEHKELLSSKVKASVAKEVCVHVLDRCGILPDKVCILPRRTLPLTTSGKLQRESCRQIYISHFKTWEIAATRHDGESVYV